MSSEARRRRLRIDSAQYLIVDPNQADGRPQLSRRRRLQIPQLEDEPVYVTDGSETLWQIAARAEVYGDPKLWWVLADANRINGIFSVMLTTIVRNTELRVPSLDTVRLVVNNGGRF